MTTIAVKFADGEPAVLALDFRSPPVIDLIMSAWALLPSRQLCRALYHPVADAQGVGEMPLAAVNLPLLVRAHTLGAAGIFRLADKLKLDGGRHLTVVFALL